MKTEKDNTTPTRIVRQDDMIAGVAGGIAAFHNLDVTLVRLALLAVASVSDVYPVVLFYLALWILLPRQP